MRYERGVKGDSRILARANWKYELPLVGIGTIAVKIGKSGAQFGIF